MNQSSKVKLQNLLSTLQSEANQIAAKQEEYQKEITRIAKLLETLKNQYTEYEYVFSPRVNKNENSEMEYCREQLKELQKEYDSLQEQYASINENIEVIIEVLTSDENKKTFDSTGIKFLEQDRQRIARDLHDTTFQHFAYIMSKLDSSTQHIDTNPIKAKMELSVAKQNLNDCMDEIRGIIYNLRPMVIDNVGMVSALRKLIDLLNGEEDYFIDAHIEEISCNNQLILTSIYRIVEECFQNIKNHAEAYCIHFIFQQQTNQLYIYIEDDGKGFDPDKIDLNDSVHFGLNMIKERVGLLGGTIQIDSAYNAGTRIRILIPLV